MAIVVVVVGLAVGAPATAGPGPTRYPTYGVAFAGPAGWTELPRDKGKTIGRWIGPGSTARNPRTMILVDCGKAKDSSVEELARGVAKEYNGAVDGTPTSLGGARALRVYVENAGPSLRPVEWIVAIHEGLAYLVIGGATPDHPVSKEMEEVRASWSWTPLEPPYKHLQMHERPVAVFGGEASMNFPALMVSHPTDPPDRALDLSLHDVARNKSDFLAYASLVQVAEGQTFEALKDQLARELPKKQKMAEPFAWHARGADRRRFLSPAIDFRPPPEAGDQATTVPVKFALVNLDGRRVVLINFTLPAATPEERAAYDTLVDRIVDSVEPSGAPR